MMQAQTEIPVDKRVTYSELVRDPYSRYKRYRADTPVVRIDAVNLTFICKESDVRAVKHNPQTFRSDDRHSSGGLSPMFRAMQGQTLMRKDGPDHLRERNAMAPAFGAKAIRGAWMKTMQDIAAEYVGRLPRGETVDLFEKLAAPFAARCLCEFLGFPDVADADMRRWSQSLIDGAGNVTFIEQIFERSDGVNSEVDLEIDRMIERWKARPNFSALSVMVNSDDPLELAQMRTNLKVSIGGGLNEPRDSIATLLFGLLANPDQFYAVKNDFGLLPAAFEEAIRWVAPIQFNVRYVMDDTLIRNIVIPRGTSVATCNASACHDEEFWDDPESFDLSRQRKAHQAFGGGPHFCQGMHLARAMIPKVLMPILIDRFPEMVLPDPNAVHWKGFFFRGPLNLPVKLN